MPTNESIFEVLGNEPDSAFVVPGHRPEDLNMVKEPFKFREQEPVVVIQEA